MKFGFRIPSLTKRIAARTSLKRVIRHNLGFKAPKGFGWFTNPKKAAYNRIYNKTSRACLVNLLFIVSFGVLTFSIPSCDFKKTDKAGGIYVKPSVNYNPKKDLYELKIQVNDLKPIQRFMKGLD
jgi:hypothetical protein